MAACPNGSSAQSWLREMYVRGPDLDQMVCRPCERCTAVTRLGEVRPVVKRMAKVRLTRVVKRERVLVNCNFLETS